MKIQNTFLGALLLVMATSVAVVAAIPSTWLGVATLTGRASVIDGDTIEIHGQHVRLHGIDAPESSQTCTRDNRDVWRCGQSAAFALMGKIGATPVTCEQTDTDVYRRIVAICTQEGEDIDAWMVAEGWAIAYREFSNDYIRQEDAAKSARRGIWDGRFVQPAQYRSRNNQDRVRNIQARPAEPQQRACNIKGNISLNTGERIYHVPGGKFYRQTVISPEHGERWFCSEQEARQAGWRRSRR